MSMIGFPLLLIPLAIYNIFAFLMPGVALTSQVIAVPLLSRAPWVLTFGDVLLALGIILAMCELVKAARPGAKYLTDHLLSFLVFAGAVAEFLLLPLFATSAFFLLTVLAGTEFFGSVLVAWRRHVPAAAPIPHEVHDETPVVLERAEEPAWQTTAPASQPVVVANAESKSDDGVPATAALAASIASSSSAPPAASHGNQLPVDPVVGGENPHPGSDAPKSSI